MYNSLWTLSWHLVSYSCPQVITSSYFSQYSLLQLSTVFSKLLGLHSCHHCSGFITVKAMGMLGNSTRGLLPLQKWLLYHSCVVSIATYSFRLWFFAKVPTKAQISLLVTMQCKTALWILGAFCTSSTGRIEALAGLIPIQLHLKKLVKQFCLGLLYFLLSMYWCPFSVLVTQRALTLTHNP